jgi:hypothetical protein
MFSRIFRALIIATCALAAVALNGIPCQAASHDLAPGWYCGDIAGVSVGGNSFVFRAWTGPRVKNFVLQNNPLPGHSYILKPNTQTEFDHVGDPRYGDPITSHDGENNPNRSTTQDYLQLIEDTLLKTTPLRIRVVAGHPSVIDGTPISLFKYRNHTVHGCIVGPAKV